MDKIIPKLVDELKSLIIDLESLSEPKEASKTFPPAKEADIAKAEKKLGVNFPPSYRECLKIHNGWKNFNFSWFLMGVNGPGATLPSKEWQADLKRLTKLVQKNPGEISLENLIPLAADFNGGYLVIDRLSPGKDGEYEILRLAPGGYIDIKFANLAAFLRRTIELTHQEIASYSESKPTLKPKIHAKYEPWKKLPGPKKKKKKK